MRPVCRREALVLASGAWAEILGKIPAECLAECPARIISKVASAINASYHAGRAASGAEVVDDCLWINGVTEHIIPLAAIRAIEIERGKETRMEPVTVYPVDGQPHPGNPRPTEYTKTRYTMDYTERV